jgi:hypothetical protein
MTTSENNLKNRVCESLYPKILYKNDEGTRTAKIVKCKSQIEGVKSVLRLNNTPSFKNEYNRLLSEIERIKPKLEEIINREEINDEQITTLNEGKIILDKYFNFITPTNIQKYDDINTIMNYVYGDNNYLELKLNKINKYQDLLKKIKEKIEEKLNLLHEDENDEASPQITHSIGGKKKSKTNKKRKNTKKPKRKSIKR